MASRPQNRPGLGKKCPKSPQTTSLSALAGDSTTGTLVINHFTFFKLPKVRFLGLKRGFPDHKVPARPQKRPELVKNYPESPKYVYFLLWQVTQPLLHWESTTLFLSNDPK